MRPRGSQPSPRSAPRGLSGARRSRRSATHGLSGAARSPGLRLTDFGE